ncbi:MAG: MerR family transcriptional regulator [Solirubrobacteraceae bacterium]|nr:MerR family transcriptional regulator [Solirubrobacteraceae bacterium]
MPTARQAQKKLASSPARPEPRRTKPMTIGAVCKTLSTEFPDISISKIRYLENQRLLAPNRTPGGYRLYSQADVARLRTILRLQRDEFLPLKVIRQELAVGRSDAATPAKGKSSSAKRPGRLPSVVPSAPEASLTREELIEETKARPELVDQLLEFGLIRGSGEPGEESFSATECEVVMAAVELSRYGVEGRNLRVFKSSADREAALLQQILSPGLRSRNAERRKEATEALEDLAAVTTHLKHLLLVGDLRSLVS